jgi:hypothetical protein
MSIIRSDHEAENLLPQVTLSTLDKVGEEEASLGRLYSDSVFAAMHQKNPYMVKYLTAFIQIQPTVMSSQEELLVHAAAAIYHPLHLQEIEDKRAQAKLRSSYAVDVSVGADLPTVTGMSFRGAQRGLEDPGRYIKETIESMRSSAFTLGLGAENPHLAQRLEDKVAFEEIEIGAQGSDIKADGSELLSQKAGLVSSLVYKALRMQALFERNRKTTLT